MQEKSKIESFSFHRGNIKSSNYQIPTIVRRREDSPLAAAAAAAARESNMGRVKGDDMEDRDLWGNIEIHFVRFARENVYRRMNRVGQNIAYNR